MRFTFFKNPRYLGQEKSTVSFQGERGELFSLSVLDHHLFRVRFLPDGKPRLDRTWSITPDPTQDVPVEGRSREDLTGFPCPPVSVEKGSAGESYRVRSAAGSVTGSELFPKEGQPKELETGERELLGRPSPIGPAVGFPPAVEIHLNPFSLRWLTGNGACFAEDLPTRAYGYDREGRRVFHYLRRNKEEVYVGLGERCGPLDKQGMRFRMVNLDALGYRAKDTDPLYKHWPFYITHDPRSGVWYGLFYDTPASCEFDLGREIDAYHGEYRYWVAEEGDLDLYLIYGPDLPSVVRRFHFLIGGMPLPPRWALGYLGSSMAYAEAPNAQEQLLRFLEQCREHEVPCHGFHLSSGYTLGPNGKRYVFTWNRERFPQPEGLFQAYRSAGIRVVSNIKPCLLTDHPAYEESARAGRFLQRSKDPESELPSPNAEGPVGTPEPEISMFWGGEGSYLDFTNPATYRWWQEQVKERLLSRGIEGTWNDNNEYEVWDDAAQCHGFGRSFRIGVGRPIQTLLMVRSSYEAQRAWAPEKRPFLISRSASPGVQRYAQTWSGDNSTSWETLKYNIPMGLGLSLSGFFNTGHDVGGFYGEEPDPELFLRWVQNGIFHPRFSIHSWHLDGTSNEPWMHMEVLPLVREAIQLRYRLLPYLYALFFEAVRKGEPIIRPLAYQFPRDPRCLRESFQFFLGPNLMVASVLEPGAKTWEVYLPAGTEWYEVDTGKKHEGGQTIRLDTPWERIPLLSPAGALVPLGEVPKPGEDLNQTFEKGHRQAWVFPPPLGLRGAFALVEDDGESLAYQDGVFSEVELAVEAEPTLLRLSARVLKKGYPIPYRSVEFLLPPGEQRMVAGGEETGKDEKGRRTVRVEVEK